MALLNTTRDMKRTMEAEAENYAANMRRCEQELWSDDGGNPMPDTTGEEDERFEITGVRSPITINHNYPQQPAPVTQPAPQQPPPATSAPASPASAAVTPTEQPKSTWKTWLARSALVAGGLGIGAGGVAGYNAITADKGKPPAVEQPAAAAESGYLQYSVEVGAPAVVEE